MKPMRFQWRPLDKARQEIRVLDLKAGIGYAPLIGQTRHVSLNKQEAPPYETISYAWGPPGLTKSILVDGRELGIPASAASALACLRLPDRMRTLWIDCICIAQNDNLEKAGQIAFMAEIFSSSTQTLAYLGDDDGTAHAAFSGFTMLYDALMEHDGETIPLMHMYNRDIRGLESLCRRINWAAMGRILSRLYFQRLWTVQEVVLGSKTTLCCGVARIDFKVVMCPMVWLNSDKGDIVRNLLGPEYPYLSRATGSFMYVTWRALASPDTEDTLLEHALGLGESLGTYEPRDRVYGLLGLLRMVRPRQPLPPTLIPDYDKPVAELFLHATRECIKGSGGLWGIEANGYEQLSNTKVEGLPTWVPAWYCGSAGPDDYITGYPAHCNLWPIRGTHMDPEPETTDTKILGARGVILEPIVKHLGTMIPCGGLEYAATHKFVQAAKAFLLEFIAGADTNTQERLNDVLTVGYPGIQFEKRWHILLEATIALDSLPVTSEPTPQRQRAEYHHSAALRRYHEAARYCKQRKVFVSQSGRLGLGPRNMEDGDVVAISKISQWPMILRREHSRGKNFYTMVGAAYIEEIKNARAEFAMASQEDRVGTFYLV